MTQTLVEENPVPEKSTVPEILTALGNFARDSVALGVALVLLIGYLAMSYFIYTNKLGLDETTWGRLMVVYGGIEAVALGAGGFLFGRDLNRQIATSAENQADQSEQNAARANVLARKAQDNLQAAQQLALQSVQNEQIAREEARALQSQLDRKVQQLNSLSQAVSSNTELRNVQAITPEQALAAIQAAARSLGS